MELITIMDLYIIVIQMDRVFHNLETIKIKVILILLIIMVLPILMVIEIMMVMIHNTIILINTMEQLANQMNYIMQTLTTINNKLTQAMIKYIIIHHFIQIIVIILMITK
jgi:hypothetical protein